MSVSPIGRRAGLPNRSTLSAVAFFTVVVLSGCGSDEITCAPDGAPAIVVTVRDSVTGEPAADGAIGRLRSPSVIADLVPVGDGLTLEGAAPAGGYRVTVDKEGYQPWSQARIDVEGDGCSVQPTTVEARLQPAAVPTA